MLPFGPKPPYAGPERETLQGILKDQRSLMLWKLEGVDRDAAARAQGPTGTSLLGIATHLAWVERWWFVDFIGGGKPDYPWTDEDPDADWRIEPGETVESISELYATAVGEADAVIEGAESLDVASELRGVDRSLRWVLVHMIEETARHVGQADILREQIDGAVGYYPPED